MHQNFIYRNTSTALPELFNNLLSAGALTHQSRNGATRELPFISITLTHPLEREILLPDRRANLAAQIAESAWVLAGRDDVDWLARYLPRAPQFSDDGKVWRGAYGRRLRAWERRSPGDVFDQVRWVVDHLKADPASRRAVMSIYDPDVDSADGKDIPCNDFLTFALRDGALDMGVTIRSNDAMWGWSGINVFEWSVLLEVIAGLVGAQVGALHFSTTSFHLYDQHWDRAGKIATTPYHPPLLPNPTPRFRPGAVGDCIEGLDTALQLWFRIEEKIRTGAPHPVVVAQIMSFPEPMLQSWLAVLHWWWTGSTEIADALLRGTALRAAMDVAVQPPSRRMPVDPERPTAAGPATEQFATYVCGLHDEKHAAYGDSWCRRGEMLGIMANLARKIDRLGVTGGGDTATDTAVDLLVYLAKYRWWLVDQGLAPAPFHYPAAPGGYASTTAAPNSLIRHKLERLSEARESVAWLEEHLTSRFTELEAAINAREGFRRVDAVDTMLRSAAQLAFRLWCADQRQAANADRAWSGYPA